MRLDRRVRRRMFWRSFLLQAAWDFRHMQGIGFAFSLFPLLRRLYPHADDRAKAVRRHLEFFNTQPYMAGIALGVAAHHEEKLAHEPSAARELRVGQLKKSLGSALAAIGDPLFWGAWRPFCLTAGAAGVLVAKDARWAGAIVATSVILYNIPVAAWRWNGIRWGFEDGEKVAFRLSGMRLQRRLRELRWATFALAALAAATLLLAPPPWLPGAMAPKAGVVALCLLLKRRGWSAFEAYPALLALGVGWALISSWS